MSEVTVAFQLDEKIYQALEQYAAALHRDLGSVVKEVLAERLDELSLRLEAEQVRALPLEDRRALARRAWGSWKLPAGANAVDEVRHLRNEWEHRLVGSE